MKRRDFLQTMLAGGLGVAGLSALNQVSLWADERAAQPGHPRRREPIDFDWRFNLGDVSDAENPSFPDRGWRILDLPHDWSIEGDIREDNPSSWHGAYLPGGIGWYRKELSWDPAWEGRNLSIDFDGVYMNSDVWINGHHLGRRPYGFISFRYELTPYLVKGTNVVAVRVDNSKQPSARWYTGSGIYRHVWLNLTHRIHVGHWGTSVSTPQVRADSASVRIFTRIENDGDRQATVRVEQVVRERRDGGEVSRTQKSISAAPGSQLEITQDLNVSDPRLWSPDEPNLYDIETVLSQGGEVIDRCSTPLGIRSLEFDPERGFSLNGKRTLIKGVCNHHDGGGAVGAAVPDDVLYHRLVQLKETGCNAIRTAHNPHSPELYAFCDALGLMVLNEAFDGWDKPKGNSKYDYGLYFDEWWERDLESFIRRDRNHPCVIAWSIGNEVGGEGDVWQKRLVDLVHRLDPTRPAAEARGYKDPAASIDIAGFNAEGERKGIISGFHRERPAKPIVGTEMPHTRQTRGVYRTQSKHPDAGSNGDKHSVPHLAPAEVFTGIPKVYCSSYDNDFFSINVRDQFKQNLQLPYLMGSFRWTGYDYLGEANDKWPTRSKDKGIFDLAGIPKDHFYLYQSLWTERPMVHLLPHWTHPGKEGVSIPVVAYSNCPRVELFFDGRSLGEKRMGEDLQLVWQVPYRPGSLRAVAKSEEGVQKAETTRKTAGAAFSVRVTPDKTAIKADRRAVARLAIAIVDRQGVMVPEAAHLLHFEVTGPGRLLGVDNGDVADLNPTRRTNLRKAFKGECVALIQTTGQGGDIQVEIRADNLQSARLRILAG